MKAEARDKLAHVVSEACLRVGGQRAYARKLGVSQAAVQGWLDCRTVPTPENISSIAAESGFSIDEFFQYLGLWKNSVTIDSGQVLKQMRQLSREELAKVLEAGVRILASAS